MVHNDVPYNILTQINELWMHAVSVVDEMITLKTSFHTAKNFFQNSF